MYNIENFKDNLLRWFDAEQREMPWRETKNPYYIWLSEIMLQQTQVATVVDYYLRFIERFPTIKSLNNAQEDEVLKLWEGLGYYSRARNFHTAIKDVYQNHNSTVPSEPEQFGNLKGVGPYTKAAVMSIAFNKPLATVDGNVFRVWSRLNNDDRDTKLQSTRKAFEQELQPYVETRAGDFNQAMMELGAMVCTPKAPLCLFCPVQDNCEAFEQGTVNDLPVKTTKVSKKIIKQHVYIIKNNENEYLIEQRTAKLLNNMWEFPMYEATQKDNINTELAMNMTFSDKPIYKLKHQFTHLQWDIEVYMADEVIDKQQVELPERMQWIHFDDKEQYNFPVSMTKIYKFLKEH
ncbi:A/G-specific adenine glycosylase [Staphylococcus kloosii]|uniref:Adenine DNA glycosylase n=1 Tax=Staphylococcus kloosii TaxID=29384 RepID=A0ABQ0XKP9_9STAP|nr:A/G-specific adenine glycosylase [Staphylococcus kloosii]AVQ35753.1 A/G-specific adenine glycosylase [Staphylococcus kloosii]MBF7021697.1 A/G-specific adenine glycosylase [Staphylococcus kloosii]PNZ03296.1 A/G-specific adenine glycosylase [Staphylococcus kloosii]PTJ75134.1 A/G-specific adenine glycosylase [Staphylococcus kloosii]SUM48811.1 A G-specific DNA glycosylase [Staphylococcus kloosii]